MPDQFFTPAEIARAMISRLRSQREELIADFAAGDGQLLRAAQFKWPEARILAADIDRRCVAALRRMHPHWDVCQGDFLRKKSTQRSQKLSAAVGKVSLVLLNPPFSGRGGAKQLVDYGGEKFTCSRSIAFVLNSIPFLTDNGRIIAILPLSCLSSEKDAYALNRIESTFRLQVQQQYGLKTFDGCAARTVVVSLRRLTAPQRPQISAVAKFDRGSCISVILVRGTLPMHKATNGLAGPGYSLVHSTDLSKPEIDGGERSVTCLRRHAVGPCVLLPRVGNPARPRCTLYLHSKKLVLSDCIYALLCESDQDAKRTQKIIHDNWVDVASRFGGTCAPYLTLANLTAALENLGFVVHQEEVERR